MRVARTCVFVFIPILSERLAHPTVLPGFDAGPNGSSATDPEHYDTSPWRARHRKERESQALPGHLFWTWFVDNPRPSSARRY